MSTIKYLGFFLLITFFSQASFADIHDPTSADDFLIDSLISNSKCIGSCGTDRMDCVRKVFKGFKPKKGSKNINIGLNACGVSLGNCFDKCDQKLDSNLTTYQNADVWTTP